MNIDKLAYIKNLLKYAKIKNIYLLKDEHKTTSPMTLQIEKDGSPVPVKKLSVTFEELVENERKVGLLGLVSMAWGYTGDTVCPYTGEMTFLNWRGCTALKEWLGSDSEFINELLESPVEKAIKILELKIDYLTKIRKLEEEIQSS